MTRHSIDSGSLAPVLVALLCLSACTSWSPPVFSPELSSDESCSNLAAVAPPPAAPSDGRDSVERPKQPNALESVVADTETARKRFLRKAGCLARDNNVAAAALIGLSSLALYKGITNPNANDLAALGVLGGATYLLAGGGEASTQQRRQLYFAGADALSCALKAVEPYRSPLFQSEARQPQPLRLDDMVKAAIAARDALRPHERTMQIELHRTAEVAQPGKRAAAGCSQTTLLACTPPDAATATAAQRARHEACLARQRLCATTPDTTRSLPPHPSVKLMRDDLAKARSQIDTLVSQAAGPLAQAQVAPRLLKEQSARIQTQVDQATGETFKDLKTVFASLGGLQPAALNVARAAVFPEAKAQASGATGRFQTPPPDLFDAGDKLAKAVEAASTLRQALLEVQASVSAVNTNLQACVPARPAPAPPEAATDEAQPARTASNEGPLTTEVDPSALAPLLGLPAGATGKEVQAAVAACQANQLGRTDADGLRLDAETRTALLVGRCKAPA